MASNFEPMKKRKGRGSASQSNSGKIKRQYSEENRQLERNWKKRRK